MSRVTITDLEEVTNLDREELTAVRGGLLAGCIDFRPTDVEVIRDALEDAGYYKALGKDRYSD